MISVNQDVVNGFWLALSLNKGRKKLSVGKTEKISVKLF